MSQNPVPLSEHPNPTTKIGSTVGGAPKTPKWDPKTVLNHSHLGMNSNEAFFAGHHLGGAFQGVPPKKHTWSLHDPHCFGK